MQGKAERALARGAFRARAGQWILSAGLPLLSGIAAPCLAATLRLPPDAGAPPGASTVVPLLIDNASGILGMDAVLTFNPSVAMATSVSKTSLSASHVLTVNLSIPGQIRISLYGPVPLSGSGELLQIGFTSVGPLNSQTPLDLVFVDINEGGIPTMLVDGSYCVQGIPAEVQNVRVTPVFATTRALLSWNAALFAVTYNVYRGVNPNLSGLACFLRGISTTSVEDDGAVPMPGRLFIYLVTSKNCRRESTLGFGLRSSGTPPMLTPVERVNSNPCP